MSDRACADESARANVKKDRVDARKDRQILCPNAGDLPSEARDLANADVANADVG